MNAATSQHEIVSPEPRQTVTRSVGLHGFEETFQSFGGFQDEQIQPQTEPAVPAILQPQQANDDILSVTDRMVMASDVSVRYHTRRKQHYDAVYKIMLTGTLLLSASAFLFNLTHQGVFGLAVIGLGTLSLVWSGTHKARAHDVLAHQHQQLLETIRLTHSPTNDNVKQWRTQRMAIQSKEPPVYWALMNDCTYDAAKSWGLRPKKQGCPPLLRPFMNWIRF